MKACCRVIAARFEGRSEGEVLLYFNENRRVPFSRRLSVFTDSQSYGEAGALGFRPKAGRVAVVVESGSTAGKQFRQ